LIQVDHLSLIIKREGKMKNKALASVVAVAVVSGFIIVGFSELALAQVKKAPSPTPPSKAIIEDYFLTKSNETDSGTANPPPILESWRVSGNSVGANAKLGSTNNKSVSFITNNIERMKITNDGRVLIGADISGGSWVNAALEVVNLQNSTSDVFIGGSFKGSDHGVYGEPTIPGSGHSGGYFYSGNNAAWGMVGAYIGSLPYKLYGNGAINGPVYANNKGIQVSTFTTAAPELIMNDSGTGVLKNGRCHINLDPTLTAGITVDQSYPLKVFIQLEGDCKGVYVTNKTQNGFDVVELQGGTSNVPFSWSIIANLADKKNAAGEIESKHVGLRFPEYQEPAQQMAE
jgi:hypothetical protein